MDNRKVYSYPNTTSRAAYIWQALEKYLPSPDGSGTMIGTWSNSTAAMLAKRPVVYSAVGTHAMYTTPGLHPYVLPWGLLHDQTDRGTPLGPVTQRAVLHLGLQRENRSVFHSQSASTYGVVPLRWPLGRQILPIVRSSSIPFRRRVPLRQRTHRTQIQEPRQEESVSRREALATSGIGLVIRE